MHTRIATLAAATFAAAALGTSAAADAPNSQAGAALNDTAFTVRIENISHTNGFVPSTRARWTLDFSPGVRLVADRQAPLFRAGFPDQGRGLKAEAEEGNPAQLAASVARAPRVRSSGAFYVALGASEPGGIRPGQTFEVSLDARPGERLFLATMFGQSNDWFYVPSENGIPLFDAAGHPFKGDVTPQIGLWDAGTEADDEPGIGPHQGPRQKMPNSGPPDSNPLVRAVTVAPYANVASVMRVTIAPRVANAGGDGRTVTRKALTLEGARAVIASARAAVSRVGTPGGAIAVVDESGTLVAMERLDNTFTATSNVSIGKARTAAIFKHPTSVYENAIKNGRVSLVAMTDLTPLQGGVLLQVDGQIVGAVGVSGTASQQQDEDVALAGSEALK